MKTPKYALTYKENNTTRILPLSKIAKILKLHKQTVATRLINNRLETDHYIVTLFRPEPKNYNMVRK